MRSQAREAGFFNKSSSGAKPRPWVGPPEKFLAISPAPTPTTGLVYKILWDSASNIMLQNVTGII